MSPTPPTQQESVDVIIALKNAEKMRIDFVANVSHELRTPLTAIKGYTETLIHDHEDGRTMDPEFLKIILKNSNRLLSLIDDLLDLSSIESGADLLHLVDVDLHEATEHVTERLLPAARAKDSRLLSDVRCRFVHADPKRLEQVMANLAENAIKYSPPQSTIWIIWDSGPSEVVLTVEDNGPGIPEKHLNRLFERFYRLDKGRSRELGGTGLGLSIVKHIMQRHQGSVSVESELGKGTRFICRFPTTLQA
jgi:two-component system phosphate regulon sensor histidine kinase PhoR